MDDWTTAFLFSIETQQTIGYGSRAISPKCFEGIMLLQIQSILGIFLDAFLLGLTFAKISRPRERARTIKFSKSATIALRDNKMCLMFRVGDIRKSQIVEAHIRAQIFRQLKTTEGKELPFYQQDLRLCYDWRNCDYDDNRYQVFLMLPLVIIHIIDKHSPFYEITPEKLKQEDFEIVVVLDGMVEATDFSDMILSPRNGLVRKRWTSFRRSEITIIVIKTVFGYLFGDSALDNIIAASYFTLLVSFFQIATPTNNNNNNNKYGLQSYSVQC
ncbi:hypothetical protein QZH41_002326 [Actinostola sp. cb2023]|nr:hypothetical protein QZH41_002326 [Actinostola sp. cb2023]